MPTTKKGTARAQSSRASSLKAKLLDFLTRKLNFESKVARKLNLTKALEMGSHPTQTARSNPQRPAALERVSTKQPSPVLFRRAWDQSRPRPLPPPPSIRTDDTHDTALPAWSPYPPSALPNRTPKLAQVLFPTLIDHIEWAPPKTRNDSPLSLSSITIDTAATYGTPASADCGTLPDTRHDAIPRPLKPSKGRPSSDMRHAYHEMQLESHEQSVTVWDEESNEAHYAPAPAAASVDDAAWQTGSRYAEYTSVTSPVESKLRHARQQKITQKKDHLPNHSELQLQPQGQPQPQYNSNGKRAKEAPLLLREQLPAQPWTGSLELRRRIMSKRVPGPLPIALRNDQPGEYTPYLRYGRYTSDEASISTASRECLVELDPEMAALMDEAERKFEMERVDFLLPDLEMGAGLREIFGKEWAVFEERM